MLIKEGMSTKSMVKKTYADQVRERALNPNLVNKVNDYRSSIRNEIDNSASSRFIPPKGRRWMDITLRPTDKGSYHYKTPQLIKKAVILDGQVNKETKIVTSISEFKDKIEPGDIVATKRSNNPILNAIRIVQLMKGDGKRSGWTHLGMVDKNKNVKHMYNKIKNNKIFGKDKRARSQSLESFSNLGRDMWILKPKVNEETKERAVKRLTYLRGREYSNMDALKAALRSKPTESDPKSKKKMICTGVSSYAYDNIDFVPYKNRFALLATDMIKSDKIKPGIAFSYEK